MNLAKNQQLTSQQMQILKAVIGLRNGEWPTEGPLKRRE